LSIIVSRRKIPPKAVEISPSKLNLQKELSMLKRLATWFSVGGVVLMAAGVAGAQTDSRLCTNGLIRGDYAFSVEGYKLGGPPGSPLGPMRGVAMTTFDGHGKLTQLDTVVVNGVKTSDFTEEPATGTYQVNHDCTGTFTLTFVAPDPRPPVTVNFVISDNGDQIDSVVVAPPTVLLIASHGRRRFGSAEGKAHDGFDRDRY
jgi:hypothetical protein